MSPTLSGLWMFLLRLLLGRLLLLVDVSLPPLHSFLPVFFLSVTILLL